MPKPDDKPKEAFNRLDEELHAFEKSRARPASIGADRSIGEGYRLMAELIGGLLGGVGIGWFVDRLAHTAPWGIAIGVSVGAGVSVYMAARTAARMGKQAMEKAGPVESVPFDDDED
jgi:ATP synthase protein I